MTGQDRYLHIRVIMGNQTGNKGCIRNGVAPKRCPLAIGSSFPRISERNASRAVASHSMYFTRGNLK
jgi:hypothetical protein